MLYARFAILALRLVYLRRTWRPLRLCARPVEYLLDTKYIGFAVEY